MDGAMTGGLGLNERAAALADAMAADAARLRIAVSTLDGGARLLDCGIAAPGGHEAGRLVAEVCLGGAGSVAFSPCELEGLRLPGVLVSTDHRALACLGSQYAGWAVKPEGYFAMGSGPLRAIGRTHEFFHDGRLFGRMAECEGVIVAETLPTHSSTVYH